MMDTGNERVDELLLDYHLGQLDAGRAARVRSALAESPRLVAKSESLQRLLGALDGYSVPPPAADLVEATLDRIAERTGTVKLPEPASALPPAAEHELAGSPVLSLRELIAVAACVTLFIGIFVPGYTKARAVAQRRLCQSNIGQIMRGTAVYAAGHGGYLPYAGAVPGGYWSRVEVPGVARASNTRHWYLLRKGGYVTDARVFICPSRPNDRPMNTDEPERFDDFAEPRNFSYSAQAMNVERPLPLRKLRPGMALFSDANPLFDRGGGHPVTVSLRQRNSLTHEHGAGQNVGFASLRVGWFTQPTVGVNRDNIFLIGNRTRYHHNETPECATDSFLIGP